PCTDHVNVEACPRVRELGAASKLVISTAGVAPVPPPPSAVTMTGAVLIAVAPLTPLAVKVYVVDSRGETCAVPLAGCFPTPWSIETSTASSTAHESTAMPPFAIEAGSARNVAITGGLLADP